MISTQIYGCLHSMDIRDNDIPDESVSRTESKKDVCISVCALRVMNPRGSAVSDANCGNQALKVSKHLNCLREPCVMATAAAPSADRVDMQVRSTGQTAMTNFPLFHLTPLPLFLLGEFENPRCIRFQFSFQRVFL